MSKAIMKRTQPRNLILRTNKSKLVYTKQRNYCVDLIIKGKKKYYGSLDVNDITDNKTFWKTVKPLFLDKSKSRRTITLVEDVHKKIADIFNNYFANKSRLSEFQNLILLINFRKTYLNLH